MSHLKQRLVTVVLSVLMCATFIGSVGAQDFGMTLPEPTGSAVGYRMYTVVDEAREELFTEEADDSRAFPVAIYYPASPAEDAVPAPYSTEAENAAYNTSLMMPPIIFESIEGHLYVDAPLLPREGGYPVLLFSPGFGSPIRFYSALLTEVASRGFIVVAVDHPYSQTVSVFPDGSVVNVNAAGSDMSSTELRDALLNIWVQDTQSTLDYLAELNDTDEVLAGAFNLEYVGAFGHSFGGATAANASLVDERVLAAINLDGSVFGPAGQGVTKPLMIIISELVEYTDEQLAAVGMTRESFEVSFGEHMDTITGALSQSAAPYYLAITGTVHSTYSSDIALMRALLPDVFTPELVGTIDGARANQIISDYTVAFFETHLLDQPSALLAGESPDYPEVEFIGE